MTPEELAGSLSHAMQRAVLNLSDTEYTDWSRVYRQRRQRIKGHLLGLHTPQGYNKSAVVMWCSIRLTERGKAVQDVLKGCSK